MWFLRQGYSPRGFLVENSVFLVIVLLENGYCAREKAGEYCQREATPIPETPVSVYWQSKGIENEIVVSSPPCTDLQGNLITRVCKNHTWIPANSDQLCSRITEFARRCPMKFQESPSSCTFISRAQPWGNICTLEALSHEPDNTPIGNELVWLPYKRLTKYGHFVSLTFGETFGIPFKKPINASITDPDFFKKDCLVVKGSSKEYYPEFCDKEHRFTCEFSKKEANSKCPDGCISADIVTDSCYCKEEYKCFKQGKVNTIFDFTVLSDLANKDHCYVGNRNSPDYSLDGFQQSLGGNIWYYTDKPLNCSLCLNYKITSAHSGEVEMVLNFDDKTKRLFLTIYSPDGLFDDASDKTIYCYTDAATYELKKREKVDKILEYKQSTRPYNVYEVNLEDGMGTYYCEAFKNMDNEDDKVQSNHVLAHKNKTGNEFAVRLIIKSICILFSCDHLNSIPYEKIVDKALNDFKSQIRVMTIYSFDFESIDMLLHVTSETEGDVLEDYRNIQTQIKVKQDNQELELIYIRSSEFCLPEVYNNLNWSLTPIGQGAVSEQPCLQQNGLPVVRFCGGKFLAGAEWKEIFGECAKDVEIPYSTKYIYSALNQTLSDEAVNNVTDVIKNDPNLPVLSIYYATKFLDKIFTDQNNNSYNSIGSTMNITNSLLDVNKQFLSYSQELLNVTDDLIDLVDDILLNTTLDSDVLLVQRSNLIIHVTNPILSGVSGLVIYQEGGKTPTVANLPRNCSFAEIGPNALIALFLPEEILNHRNGSNVTLITTVYFKDAFFESNYNKKPSGPVVSITIPEFGGYLPSTIPILFKVSNYTDTPECGFWDYGKKTVRKKGHWSTVGGNYLGEYNITSNYHVCLYSHLTHFSLLTLTLGSEFGETDDQILDSIAIIGDTLSIMGIAGTFLTAIMFKRWRKKQGTVILLNLSVSILLEITLMQISDTTFFTMNSRCSVFGVFIHYIVTCKFCWMLVYSFLQYMRFVKVLSILPENIVLKSTIFGWGFALIPVIIVNASGATYKQKRYNYCYPEGKYLYLGFLMPICLIIFINTFVFIAVMREVTSKTVESHGSKENVQKLQIQLACLLFFVLGVPWMFWLFANFIQINWLRLTFVYLFTITSNIQGFILFLFYVVFNNDTRTAWLNYFKKTRPKSFSISTRTTSRS